MMQCAEYFKDEYKVQVKLSCVISCFHREVVSTVLLSVTAQRL